MSSLRNARKTQRVHQERHQPAARKHLGPLEKKKDYKIRATDQNKKKEALQTLRRKALEKNPDEFHYHMVKSQLKDGEHFEKVEDEELSVKDVMHDLTYITHRRSVERKKIEKLKAKLHILNPNDEAPKNKHILFVDSKKEAKAANPAKMLDTHPALLGRNFNRLKSSQLAKMSCSFEEDAEYLKKLRKSKSSGYKELAQRIERENKLRIMQEKLEVRKKLMNVILKLEYEKTVKGKDATDRPKMVAEGTGTTAPVFKWPQVRKK